MQVIQVKTIKQHQMQHMIDESSDEGYSFVAKLVTDFQSGATPFTDNDELLLAIINDLGEFIAVGGIMKDPYNPKSGRIRRFYVMKSYRKQGLGKKLLQKLLKFGTMHYEVVHVRTPSLNNASASAFYESQGFLPYLSDTTSHRLQYRDII